MSSLCSRLLVALVGFLLAACASAAGSSRQAVSVSCAEAVYTTRAEAPPHAVQAVLIGPVIFNSLAHLTSRHGIDRPSRRLPFYTVKSPLTILASARRGVSISLVAGRKERSVRLRPLLDEAIGRLAQQLCARTSQRPPVALSRRNDEAAARHAVRRRSSPPEARLHHDRGSGQRRRSSTPKNGPGRRAALLKGFAAVSAPPQLSRRPKLTDESR